jgi:hypothetical protein
VRSTRRKLRRILPYQIAALCSVAVAISFAAATAAMAGSRANEAVSPALQAVQASPFD